MAACHHPRPPAPVPVPAGQVFVGVASYYGREFAGRTTSSGEKYDPSGYTAAHRTLPFGTSVRVTNLENQLSVIVRINDRGPQREDRILDLSLAAARELNMVQAGVVKVRVEILR